MAPFEPLIERVSPPSETGGPPQWSTWIIDVYTDQNSYSDHSLRGRTNIGDLIYRAKYMSEPSARNQVAVVTRHTARQLHDAAHPAHKRFGEISLTSIDGVVAVPFFPGVRNQDDSLPHIMATAIAMELRISDLSAEVSKVKSTSSMKLSKATESHATPDWFDCTAAIANRRLLVVDDVYRTGATLRALGDCLWTHGARALVGLCLAKASAGMRF